MPREEKFPWGIGLQLNVGGEHGGESSSSETTDQTFVLVAPLFRQPVAPSHDHWRTHCVLHTVEDQDSSQSECSQGRAVPSFLVDTTNCLSRQIALQATTTMVYKMLLAFGFCSLLHAAFSAAQYRSFLRVSEQQFTGHLPGDIIAQAIISLFIAMYSVVSVSGDFKVIQADDDFSKQRYDLVFSTQKSFVNFKHRGRILTRNATSESALEE